MSDFDKAMKPTKQDKIHAIELMIECIQNELDGHEHPAWERFPPNRWKFINHILTQKRDSLRRQLDKMNEGVKG